jgi:hypothetical protein
MKILTKPDLFDWCEKWFWVPVLIDFMKTKINVPSIMMVNQDIFWEDLQYQLSIADHDFDIWRTVDEDISTTLMIYKQGTEDLLFEIHMKVG